MQGARRDETGSWVKGEGARLGADTYTITDPDEVVDINGSVGLVGLNGRHSRHAGDRCRRLGELLESLSLDRRLLGSWSDLLLFAGILLRPSHICFAVYWFLRVGLVIFFVVGCKKVRSGW